MGFENAVGPFYDDSVILRDGIGNEIVFEKTILSSSSSYFKNLFSFAVDNGAPLTFEPLKGRSLFLTAEWLGLPPEIRSRNCSCFEYVHDLSFSDLMDCLELSDMLQFVEFESWLRGRIICVMEKWSERALRKRCVANAKSKWNENSFPDCVLCRKGCNGSCSGFCCSEKLFGEWMENDRVKRFLKPDRSEDRIMRCVKRRRT